MKTVMDVFVGREHRMVRMVDRKGGTGRVGYGLGSRGGIV